MKAVITSMSLMIVFVCSVVTYAQDNSSKRGRGLDESSIRKKKVLYINSYHSGYEWSDGIEKGILEVFKINNL